MTRLLQRTPDEAVEQADEDEVVLPFPTAFGPDGTSGTTAAGITTTPTPGPVVVNTDADAGPSTLTGAVNLQQTPTTVRVVSKEEMLVLAKGDPDIAGSAQPALTIKPSTIAGETVTANVDYTSTISVRKDMVGTLREPVLMDHERQHITEGWESTQDAFQPALADDITNLGLTSPWRPSMGSQVKAAAIVRQNEAVASSNAKVAALDAVDYPRMEAGMLGAEMTLDELRDQSPYIAAAVDAAQALSTAAPAERLARAEAFVAAHEDVGMDELPYLQYHPPFKAFVTGAIIVVDMARASATEEEATVFDDARAGLAEYTWTRG